MIWRLVFLGATLILASCATPQERIEWGEEVVVEKREVEVELKDQAAFDSAASASFSATTCVDQARRRYERSRAQGAMMMKGCMRRDDFVSLIFFKEDPWKNMRFTEGDFPLLLTVAMRRGRTSVAEDLQQFRIDIKNWQNFAHEEKKNDGSLILANALVLQERRDSGGVVSTVRLYGDIEATGPYSYTRTRRWSEFNYSNSRVNIVPLGITLEVRSRESLPRDRRVQLIGRYNAASTTRMIENQRRAAERSTEVLSSKEVREREPLASGFVDVLMLLPDSESRGKDIN